MSIGHELEKLWGRDCRENNQRRHTEFHSLRCYDSSLILIVDFPSGEEFIYIKSTTYSSLLVLLLFWELHPRAICCWKKTKHVGLHLHLLLLQLELSLLLNLFDFKLLCLQGKPFLSMILLCFVSSLHTLGHIFVERHHVVGRQCWRHAVNCCLSLVSTSQLTNIICRQCI